MKKTTENSEHDTWGSYCSAWHFVKSERLSVIEEVMPPHSQEKKHYHQFSQQFFKILSGKATFEIDDEIVEIEKEQGIHILSKTIHRIRNDQPENLEFIVISEPTTKGDRFDHPDNEN
ncbi:MAG: cupin domain-containing protein [Bacteroidales bacterium]|nr:cupin domain-containing protein [Bacteroidales bacterium]